MTKELLECIQFALGCFGAMCIVVTFTYALKNMFKLFMIDTKQENKKLIKETIKEFDTPYMVNYQEWIKFKKYQEFTKNNTNDN